MVEIDVMSDDLIELREVATRQKVTIQTVNLWRRSGRLQCVKVGGRWKTTKKAMNAFAVRNGSPPQPHEPQHDPAHEEAMRELSQRFARR